MPWYKKNEFKEHLRGCALCYPQHELGARLGRKNNLHDYINCCRCYDIALSFAQTGKQRVQRNLFTKSGTAIKLTASKQPNKHASKRKMKIEIVNVDTFREDYGVVLGPYVICRTKEKKNYKPLQKWLATNLHITCSHLGYNVIRELFLLPSKQTNIIVLDMFEECGRFEKSGY